MRVLKSVPVEDIACRGSIKDSDVQRLARAFAQDPIVSADEADALVALHRAAAIQAPSWGAFFTDTLADYIVTQDEPAGYLNAEKSRRLIGLISSNGVVASRVELELLLAVLERARWFPMGLTLFALAQIRDAVVQGTGPLRAGNAAVSRAGLITEGEVELVRSILCAFGSDGRLAVTRQEADMLSEINSAAALSAVPQAWSDLYVKAVANLVLAAEGYAVPERALALRRELQFATAGGIEGQVAASLAWVRRDYGRQSHEEQALSRLERQRVEIVTGEEFASPEDSAWVARRYFGESRLSPLEAAAVNHLRRECLVADAAWPRVRGAA